MNDKYVSTAEKSQLRKFFNILFNALLAIYPVLFFVFLIILKIPVRIFSVVIIVLSLLELIIVFSKRKKNRQNETNLWNSIFLLVIGVICFIINSSIVFKYFPVIMNVVFLYTFGITLFKPPLIIYRFAVLVDKIIPKSLANKQITSYCYKVTVVWCLYFLANGIAATLIAIFGTDFIWVLYNTVITGTMTGLVFVIEFIVRIIVQRKLPKAVPLSSFKDNSRNLSGIICYDGAWSDGVYYTYGDFLKYTSILRNKIETIDSPSNKWLLYCEDYWFFLLAFTALLQCKKEIILSANVSPSYIAEIKEDANFITDQVFSLDSIYGKSFNIQEILSANTEQAVSKCPIINKDETSIVLFTSGTTGTPKKITQRLTELENDNAFILSMWGEEILKRKIASTVNQHHIYGLLFSIMLPFTAGVPFRKQMIRVPEEYLKLNDTEYTIVTVPAFLKRGVEVLGPDELNLKDPWIFVSGGVLNPELAEKTNNVFGFWPLEIYGSTETSGIAWRQSCNGIEWKPFDDVTLSQNNEGCLIIRSPYIKDPEGFETADTVEILQDGRFILKERIDSVVKIEGKRISLTEMEARIMQTGLVTDVCVVSMQNARQYLAAVIVFNEKGKEKFNNLKKPEINKYFKDFLIQYFENIVIPKRWRYLQAIVQDNQGKKKIEEIRQLFDN